MKRLFIVASLAIAAIGCQKTEIQNEVLTPIGFSTEVGKQTRAIVQNDATYSDHFGVFSYLTDANAPTGTSATNVVMNNQKVTAAGQTVDASGNSVAYYWPNDPDNTISFYAYSPYAFTSNINIDASGKVTFASYNHVNYYGSTAVDFMVATPVIGATFDNQNGGEVEQTNKPSKVPVAFKHEMAQVKFEVTASAGPVITLKSITFNNALQTASYDSSANPKWSGTANAAISAYPLDHNAEGETVPTDVTNPLKSTPIIMLPITPASITVTYTVFANEVTENVVETFPLSGTTAWAANKVYTYKLNIGLNVITFDADVEGWENADPITLQ